jgi:hypothetical protein
LEELMMLLQFLMIQPENLVAEEEEECNITIFFTILSLIEFKNLEFNI